MITRRTISALLALGFALCLCAACTDDVVDSTGDVGGEDTGEPQDDADGPGEDVGEPVEDVEEDEPPPVALCEANARRCADARTLEVCEDPQVGFEARPCVGDQVCEEGACGDPICVVGDADCLNPSTIQRCEAVDGLPSLTNEVCPEGEVCDEARCQPQICDPEALPTCLDLSTARFCDPPGVALREMPCFEGQVCLDNGCQTQLCVPGSTICRGDAVEICNELGTAYEVQEVCEPDEVGTRCADGQCVNACTAASLERSYLGCAYTGLDLPNSSAQLSNGYGISVANTSDTLTAQVTISTEGNLVETLSIEPLSVGTYVDTTRDFKLRGTGVFPLAFRVESTVPVVVYQFNSYETIRAASTDGSLLIPDHALFDQYFAMTYSGDRLGAGSEPFIAITTATGGAAVTVTPTANVTASINGSLQVIPALQAGSSTTIALDDPFEVLVLKADTGLTDLTGTLIEADAPIGVYSGNFATQVPTGRLFRDHLEQQIFPRQALGERYIVAKSAERGNNVNVPDQLRILADLDGTEITFTPPINASVTINAGQFIEVAASEHVEINSNQPVMIGQFFGGSQGIATLSEGDPTFILQVPIEQFRDNYVFTCPPTYTTDRVAITAPIGAQLALDDIPILLSQEPVGQSTYSVTIVVVEDGEHHITGDLPFGISVYGVGGPPGEDPNGVQNVSYGYPGGLNLNEINPKE